LDLRLDIEQRTARNEPNETNEPDETNETDVTGT